MNAHLLDFLFKIFCGAILVAMLSVSVTLLAVGFSSPLLWFWVAFNTFLLVLVGLSARIDFNKHLEAVRCTH